MLNKNIFLKNFSFNSQKFYRNLSKSKKVYKIFESDLKNFDIPLLKSYEKNYTFGFSQKTIKKFSRYKNIIIIGMGGSILGAKSIYFFLQPKIKKQVFFLII